MARINITDRDIIKPSAYIFGINFFSNVIAGIYIILNSKIFNDCRSNNFVDVSTPINNDTQLRRDLFKVFDFNALCCGIGLISYILKTRYDLNKQKELNKKKLEEDKADKMNESQDLNDQKDQCVDQSVDKSVN